MIKYEKISNKRAVSESSLSHHYKKDSLKVKRPLTVAAGITNFPYSKRTKGSTVVQAEKDINISKRTETVDHIDDLQEHNAQGDYVESSTTSTNRSTHSGSFKFTCNDCVNINNGSNLGKTNINDDGFEFNCTSIVSSHLNVSTSNQNNLRDLSTLVYESIGSNMDVSQTFEINDDIYLILPSKSSRTSCQESEDLNFIIDNETTKTRGLKRPIKPTACVPETLADKKIFNLRIKDEMKVDLEISSCSSLYSILEAHQLNTIEEVTESSRSSTTSLMSLKPLAKKKRSQACDERERANIILKEALFKARNSPRPQTRKSQTIAKPIPLPRSPPPPFRVSPPPFLLPRPQASSPVKTPLPVYTTIPSDVFPPALETNPHVTTPPKTPPIPLPRYKPVPLPRNNAVHKADCCHLDAQPQPSPRHKNEVEVDLIANTINAQKDNYLTILERQHLLNDECYSIQRYLSDMVMPLETTEEDKLLDDVSTIDSKQGLPRNSQSTLNDSIFTFDSSKYGKGCCLRQIFKSCQRLCRRSRKHKLQ